MYKQQIAEFLRNCRARLSPADIGLPEHGRRRTPGLRREDVAAVAGVSVTWYTWLEQGRDIKMSARVLERICKTLHMSSEEREYLFALVQGRAPPYPSVRDGLIRDGLVSPALQRMVDTLNVPALIKTARWDIVAWNRLAAKAFRDYGELPPEERNLLRILLVDDTSYQQNGDAYRETASRVISKFRVDFGQYSEDPSFLELIEDLMKHCELFRELWNSPQVTRYSEAIAYHPQHGGMWFEHTTHVPEGNTALRLIVFVPNDEATAAKLARIAASSDRVASGSRPSPTEMAGAH